jgi:LmbE family N-acetylglucosaminyl deacetylase
MDERKGPKHRGALFLSCLVLVPTLATAQETMGESRGYVFDLSPGGRSTLELQRTSVGVQVRWVAPGDADWDTAFLGLRLDAEGVAAPWVEMLADGERVEQHLEAGAQGLHWLNITGLRPGLREGEWLELRGHGATLEPGVATVLMFQNDVSSSAPMLILAPHPDDAEIASFGLYSAARDVTIVTLTSGNAGDFNYRANASDPAEHYLLKGFLRSVDSVTVPWLGGVPPERCYNLGYFDARLTEMYALPDRPIAEMYGPNEDTAVYRRGNVGDLVSKGSRANTWNNLVGDLVHILERVQPKTIVMPYPQLDSHPDHQYTSVAAIEAIRQWQGSAAYLLYTNHAGENRYPYGPAGTVMSLPPSTGPALPVQGIYSHTVDAETQRMKLFALEAMHDLRLSPEEQRSCGVPDAPARRADYPRTDSVDYFRRAVRSEEVFFVFDDAGARALIDAFLSAPAQPD